MIKPLKVCRRDRYKRASASGYKAINTGDVIIRRLADMHWICNNSDKQQQHTHDGGNNGYAIGFLWH